MSLLPSDPGPERTILGTFNGLSRYRRWDGSQRLPDFTADELLDEISDDLLAEADLGEALRRLLDRGMRRPPGSNADDLPGLRDLLDRLRERRQELLDRYQLGDVLSDVREELDAVIETERRGIERRLAPDAAMDEDLRRMASEMARRRQDQLEALPQDPGGRIKGLQEYDFMEPAARERFEALLDRLRHQVLDSLFEGLSEAIQNVTPDQLAANRDMIKDLNHLLSERLAGEEPSQSRVDDFLAQHGRFFPGAQTLDDIVEQLGERMAAMQSLLASMSPQQREELQSMMDSLLRDDRLRWDLAQLAATLDRLLPDGLGERMRFRGDEPLSLEGALAQMGQLQRMDRLADQLLDAGDGAAIGDLDPAEVAELMGDESAQDVRALQELARALEEAGYAERTGDHLELTPRGSRRLGQRVLDQLFAKLRKDAFGGHSIARAGSGGERTDESTAWEFGRPFHLDLQRTLANALTRADNSVDARSGREGERLLLDPSDFAVFQTEELSDAATVLLVDMSRSMLLRGCFLAAKKVAVALDTLIRTQFPRDRLHVVGFAYYAREIRPQALAGLSWQGYEYGTNLQHGLMLGRRLLARDHSANKQIVVITDGEPTAHFEDGQVEFSYPPTRRTIAETLREVVRCTREGVTINTFMLERSRALAEFVDRMTRLNRGRAFYASPEHLGQYVLVDYVDRKRKRS
ncbi:MAG: hypothetical protein QOH61_2270 [Chloroflexota bacterium]|jgi:uncharacterized protein with von Willebrand factor type A (vWA) domain|nr:hypothetical protein [Chloroflexota bacterium]